MRSIRLIVFALVFLLDASLGWPCSCAKVKNWRKPTRNEVLAGEYKYFEGEVEEVKLGESSSHGYRTIRRLVRFRVLKFYNGPEVETILVDTGIGFGDCGFAFFPGRRYLVSARKNEMGYLETGICGSTSLLEYALREQSFLRGDPETPSRVAGELCGRIKDENGKAPKYAIVTVWRDLGKGIREYVGTEEVSGDGLYRVKNLPPGRYIVGAQSNPTGTALAKGFYGGGREIGEAVPVELGPRRKRCGLDFSLLFQPLYAIQGRIETNNRLRPPPGIVLVVLISAPDAAFPEVTQRMMNADGSFVFGNVPKGRFSITAQIQTSPEAGDWSSEVLDLEASENRDTVVLKVIRRD